jgi:nicotinamidase-related amidase
MRIKRENCTGLIIDIQEKLFPVIAEKESLLARCKILLEGMNILGIPTIFTQQYTKGLGSTLPEITSLYPNFTYIEKSSFSCLDDPGYASVLVESGRTTVIIAGIESHVCVLQTAVDLRERGYFPVVISDCISSRNLFEKQIALSRFATEGIRVSTTESVLFELTRYSNAAEFKAISKIIK